MRVYGVIGWKNSGKTGLMERLVAEITGRGFTVSTVKHVHHDVALDVPGKDTFRHRAAGATETVLASAHRFALMHEHQTGSSLLVNAFLIQLYIPLNFLGVIYREIRQSLTDIERMFALMREHRGPEPELPAILSRLAPVDLVLVEGYKRDAHPKVEVWREETGHPLIQPGDPLVRAVATDAVLSLPVPVLDLNDTARVADFILREVGLAV